MFYFERILERISLSKYKNKFILKGGLLLSSIIGDDERTTKDMDATLKSIPLTMEFIENMFNEILKIEINDGVTFEIISIKDIRLEDDYGGFRINVLSMLDKNKTFVAIEITSGDRITPKEIKYNYNCIFEDKKIPIMAYNLETIIAEKFHSLITRGVLNTRMKDFYDLYILINTKRNNIKDNVLSKAVIETFNKRNTIYDIKEFYNVLNDLKESKEVKNMWNVYQKQTTYVKNIDFNQITEVVETIINILKKNQISLVKN